VESHAFQDLPRKRIKKLAARITDDEIRVSLNEDAENFAFIFEHDTGTSIMFWNAFNGPMIMLNDDSVLAYAQREFLRRHGYPVLHSMDEIESYATLHNWPRKKRNTKESGSV
jgi:hypothetical protein